MSEEKFYELVDFPEMAHEQCDLEMRSDEGATSRAIMAASLHDSQGQRVLIVYQMDMEAMAPRTVVQAQRVLEAQHQTPVLILPRSIKILKMREISAGAARQAMDAARREHEQRTADIQARAKELMMAAAAKEQGADKRIITV